MRTTKPFHESIVDYINNCKSAEKLEELAQLVIDTMVPKNHDDILNAFNLKKAELHWRYEFLESLLEEKLMQEKAVTATTEKK